MAPEKAALNRNGAVKMKIHNRRFLTLLLISFLFSGCAHLFGKAKSEQALRGKVTQEWEAKQRGDWGVVYDLTTKEFKRKITRDKFVGGTNLQIESYAVNEIIIDSDQGKASVQVGFDINYMGKAFKGARTTEEWIWEDGEWRLNLKSRKTPFD